MSNYHIVAFSGPAGAGKSTAAELWKSFNSTKWVRRSFATPLKTILGRMDPILDCWNDEGLRSLIACYGERGVKERYPEYRRLLQDLGEGIRDWDPTYFARIMHESIWSHASSDWEGREGGSVIDDLRLPVEHSSPGTTAKALGCPFTHIRVDTSRLNTLDDHYTETALRWIVPDYVVQNDGDVADLSDKLKAIYEEVVNGAE